MKAGRRNEVQPAEGRECVSLAAFQDFRESVQGRSVFLLSPGKMTRESFIENMAPRAPFLSLNDS